MERAVGAFGGASRFPGVETPGCDMAPKGARASGPCVVFLGLETPGSQPQPIPQR